MTLGYDQAVALPAMQSDGQGGQDELFKETNKARHGRSSWRMRYPSVCQVFDLGKGVIEMEVNKAGRVESCKWQVSGLASLRKVNQELGEIGGVFVSKQPSDTDMGAKAGHDILKTMDTFRPQKSCDAKYTDGSRPHAQFS